MSINKVIISGNLTRDAELRQTNTGMSVLKFSVAVNDRIKKNDYWEDYPNYIDCTLWGSRADTLSQYLVKGLKVAIDGKLRYSSWETQNGDKRSKIEVICDNIEFMSRKENNTNQQQPQLYNNQAYSQNNTNFDNQSYSQTDIPF